MKLSALFTFSLIAFAHFSLAQTIYFPPADLTGCHAKRWDRTRLAHGKSLQFETLDQACVARFEITPEEGQISKGWRAEIEDDLRTQNRAKITYEFSTYLPESLDDRSVPPLVLAQWHDNKRPGVPAQRPPLALRLREGKLVMTLFNQRVLDRQGKNGTGIFIGSTKAVFGKWIRWKVKAYWLPSNGGYVRVWMNGKPFANFRGETSYAGDVTAPYFKIGIYTTHKFNKPLHVFHSGYRRTYAEPMFCDLEKNRGHRNCRRLER